MSADSHTISGLTTEVESPMDLAIDAMWESRGGVGPAPMLYMSPTNYRLWVQAGASPGKLAASGMMPEHFAMFFNPEFNHPFPQMLVNLRQKGELTS